MTEVVLMVTSVASMIKQFNMDNIAILQELGYQVHVATNFEHGSTMSDGNNSQLKHELDRRNVKYHQVDFPRGIGSPKSLFVAMRQLSKIIQKTNYAFIHCQSPVGGVCGRLVGHKFHVKVLYTAHGFQFFHGGPKKDWLLFYPVERFLAKYTHRIITINHDDFQLAKKFSGTDVSYIPGVGIKYNQISSIELSHEEVNRIKAKLDISPNSVVIISIGELSKRKNHQAIIKCLPRLKSKNVYYIICGYGAEKNNLELLAERLGVSDRVKILGYRTDIGTLVHIADISAFPSKREGLGLAGLEAMAAGLPLITSNVQGIKDYSIDGVTGFVAAPSAIDEYVFGIQSLIDDEKLRHMIGQNNVKVAKQYDIEEVNKLMRKIYSEI